MRKSACAIFAVLLFIFCNCTVAWTADIYRTVDRLSSFIENLSDLDMENLIVDRELTRFYYKDGPVGKWLPSSKLSEHIENEIRAIGPTIGVESIRVMQTPKNLRDINNREHLILRLYNITRRVSTIEGIDYYSASRERKRTFFKQFYAVDTMKNSTRIPDPVVESIPPKDSVLVFQQDLTFGKNYSELTYRHHDDYISLSIKNLKTMWYGIIPLIAPENMQVNLIIRPLDGYIMFYGNSAIKTTISLFGIEKSKTDSFENRITALYNWFSSQVGLFKNENER